MNRTAMSSEIGNIQRNLAYSALICMCCYQYKKEMLTSHLKEISITSDQSWWESSGHPKLPAARSLTLTSSWILNYEKSVVHNGNQCNIQFKLNFYDNV
jgi:hypothetical protein